MGHSSTLIRKALLNGLRVIISKSLFYFMTLLFLVSSFADACLSSALLAHGLYPCRHNRAEVIQNFAWKVGLELLELPEEIQEKLSPSEKNYFGKHSSALQSYMAEVGIDLNVDMVPPKDPYIKVRVLDDMGEGILLSDKTANLALHSMHFLKRTDAEQYIARGLMEELTG
uniref:GINS subunit domain-containing protein n=1 Tax=Salix viminalis TaxID=40686 RepID=A0A6N2LBW6_SALVM